MILSEKLNSVEDFQLDIHVLNVQPVGDSAAMVKSRVSERATFVPRQGELGSRMGREQEFTTGQGPRAREGEDSEDAQSRQRGRQLGRGQSGSVQLESHATCTHLIERDRDAGRLQIAMGICNAQTEAQL